MKGKSAENYNGTPYVATLLSCSLWILYGLLDPDDGVLIVTVNAAGVSMQALYLIILFIYSSKEKRVTVVKCLGRGVRIGKWAGFRL